MTRIPRPSVDSISRAWSTHEHTDAQPDTAPGGHGGITLYGPHQTRFSYGLGSQHTGTASMRMRLLQKLAARKRQLARRQRTGGNIDETEDDLGALPAPDTTVRAARRGPTGGEGDGGTGGQSRHGDDSGAHAGDSSGSHDTVDIKAQWIPPVPAPQPGALTALVSAAQTGTVRPEQLVEDWFAGFASLRKRLAAQPDAAIDATILEKILDKFEALRNSNTLPVQGMVKWRQMLIDERGGGLSVAHSSTASKSTRRGPRNETAAGTVTTAAKVELSRLQRFNALLPLLLFQLDLPSPPSRAAVSINVLTTMRGAALTRQGKR